MLPCKQYYVWFGCKRHQPDCTVACLNVRASDRSFRFFSSSKMSFKFRLSFSTRFRIHYNKKKPTRYHSRFFVRVGQETTHASSENYHFLTISCHRQTYQNYERPPKRFQSSYFQIHFPAIKISGIFLTFFL